MNLHQLNWKIQLLEGLLIFREGEIKIGQLKISSLFGNSYVAEFKSCKYIIHPEILEKSRIRMYNSANDRQLAVVTLKFWKSEARMQYQGKEYQLKSIFFGILGTYWTNNEERRYVSFSNQIFNGTILESVPDEEMYHLFILSAIQSMFIYSLSLIHI